MCKNCIHCNGLVGNNQNCDINCMEPNADIEFFEDEASQAEFIDLICNNEPCDNEEYEYVSNTRFNW